MIEQVEVCPYCDTENIYPDWNVKEQGFIATCQNCGKKIFLCDACMHEPDNEEKSCDWHTIEICRRGVLTLSKEIENEIKARAYRELVERLEMNCLVFGDEEYVYLADVIECAEKLTGDTNEP